LLYLTTANDVWDVALQVEPDYVLSLVDPGSRNVELPRDNYQEHMRIEFHDIRRDVSQFIAPSENDVRDIINFGRRWAGKGDCIVHCMAGRSRSTAAILILLAQINAGGEQAITEILASKAPHATPNTLIIKIGDHLLGCNGRLINAVAKMPKPSDEPFMGYIHFSTAINP
jgi:predicted protein tyrosine phosphatase